MKALLDTNIIIHRETDKIMNQDIGILFRWLDRGNYKKVIHPITIEEVKTHKDEQTVKTFLTKLDSYELIHFASPMQDAVKAISVQLDKNQNDIYDSTLLNEVFIERVDIFITEDKKIHRKAALLGIADRVFKIETFLEKVFAENPELVNYKILNVRKKHFAEIDLNDDFFLSLKEDYIGFDRWFVKKADELAYITQNAENGKLLSFLYLKVENADEVYADVTPNFKPKKRLKVGTFKVISNGVRLGERFMKIIFDNALANKVEEIYVTIYIHREEQRRLIDLMEQWGFVEWGTKGSEKVFVRNFIPVFDINNLHSCFPYINKSANKYIVPIYPDYHTSLLPDSKLNNESPLDFIEDLPHRNGLNKAYVSRAILPHPKKGDILIFYRTGGYRQSVISTIAIVNEIVYNIKSESEFMKICSKTSVYSEAELKAHWNYKNNDRLFVIKFLYVYSFPRRLNMEALINLGILKGLDDAPRGFKPISNEQFNLILKETQSDESFIIN
jgi:hypothetical protein